MAALPGCGKGLTDLGHAAKGGAPQESAATGARAGATAANKFAQHLLEQLDARPQASLDNVAFAPTSLSAALMMLTAGAAGATRDGLLATLGYDAAATDPVAATASLVRATAADDATSGTKVVSADRPFVQAGLTLQPAYAAALKTQFGVDVGTVDFRAAPEDARVAINAWAAAGSGGMVKALLPAGAVTAMTRLVTADTLFLDAPWRWPFDPALTSMQPFTTADGVVQTTTMREIGKFILVDSDESTVLELPLAGERFVVDIVLPKEGHALLSAAKLLAQAETLRSAPPPMVPVAVELPLFSMKSSLRLDDELKALGMDQAFGGKADFSKLVLDDQVAIDSVHQQVAIDFNEGGTRAGVATGVVVNQRLALPHPAEFSANRPFAYVVRDRATGAFVIVGRVADPRKL